MAKLRALAAQKRKVLGPDPVPRDKKKLRAWMERDLKRRGLSRAQVARAGLDTFLRNPSLRVTGISQDGRTVKPKSFKYRAGHHRQTTPSYMKAHGKAMGYIRKYQGGSFSIAVEKNPQKLLTKEVLATLPPLYSQENVADPIACVKFFTPWTNWTWYATEFDGTDTFFGLVYGHEEELGYFSLAELQSIRGPGGLRIERDMYFKPVPLSKVKGTMGGATTNPLTDRESATVLRGARDDFARARQFGWEGGGPTLAARAETAAGVVNRHATSVRSRLASGDLLHRVDRWTKDESDKWVSPGRRRQNPPVEASNPGPMCAGCAGRKSWEHKCAGAPPCSCANCATVTCANCGSRVLGMNYTGSYCNVCQGRSAKRNPRQPKRFARWQGGHLQKWVARHDEPGIKLHRVGDNVRVHLSKEYVQNFKSRWPASGLPDRAVWFEFTPIGDLVDLHPYKLDGEAKLRMMPSGHRGYPNPRGRANPSLANPLTEDEALSVGMDAAIDHGQGKAHDQRGDRRRGAFYFGRSVGQRAVVSKFGIVSKRGARAYDDHNRRAAERTTREALGNPPMDAQDRKFWQQGFRYKVTAPSLAEPLYIETLAEWQRLRDQEPGRDYRIADLGPRPPTYHPLDRMQLRRRQGVVQSLANPHGGKAKYQVGRVYSGFYILGPAATGQWFVMRGTDKARPQQDPVVASKMNRREAEDEMEYRIRSEAHGNPLTRGEWQGLHDRAESMDRQRDSTMLTPGQRMYSLGFSDATRSLATEFRPSANPGRRGGPQSMSMDQIDVRIWEMAAKVAQDAARHPNYPTYLWIKPSTATEWGELKVSDDAPGPGWRLAITEQLRFFTPDQLKFMVHGAIRRLPLLPTAEGRPYRSNPGKWRVGRGHNPGGFEKYHGKGEVDPDGATELELFIRNDSELYHRQEQPIILNLMRRMRAGSYDHEKSVTLWLYLVDAGAKKYVKEVGGDSSARIDSMFNKATRRAVAESMRDYFETEAKLGNYDKFFVVEEGKRYRRRYGPERNPAVGPDDPRWLVKGRKVLASNNKAIIERFVGSLHAALSDNEVRDQVLAKLSGKKRQAPEWLVKLAIAHGLKVHAKNRGLYGYVMGGQNLTNPLTGPEIDRLINRAREKVGATQLNLSKFKKSKSRSDLVEAAWNAGRAEGLQEAIWLTPQEPVAKFMTLDMNHLNRMTQGATVDVRRAAMGKRAAPPVWKNPLSPQQHYDQHDLQAMAMPGPEGTKKWAAMYKNPKYQQRALLEVPLGELVDNWALSFWFKRRDGWTESIKGDERLAAQGLEGKAVIPMRYYEALTWAGHLPEHRFRIVIGKAANRTAPPGALGNPWYHGFVPGKGGEKGQHEAFFSGRKPTPQTHGHRYWFTQGPFKTAQKAAGSALRTYGGEGGKRVYIRRRGSMTLFGGNPMKNPVTAGEYARLRARVDSYEAARKKFDPKRYQRGGGYDPADVKKIEQMAGAADVTNDERAQVELYEFVHKPPDRYFAYYNKGLTEITGWTGLKLGDIVWKGYPYKDNLGGQRVNIRVRAINGLTYSGTCNMSSGTYCRLKAMKGRSTLRNPLLRRESAKALKAARQMMTKAAPSSRYPGVFLGRAAGMAGAVEAFGGSTQTRQAGGRLVTKALTKAFFPARRGRVRNNPVLQTLFLNPPRGNCGSVCSNPGHRHGRRNPPSYTWVVTRDRKELARFTGAKAETEAWKFVHSIQSQSVDWAVKYEGYDLVALDPQGNRVWSYRDNMMKGRKARKNPKQSEWYLDGNERGETAIFSALNEYSALKRKIVTLYKRNDINAIYKVVLPLIELPTMTPAQRRQFREGAIDAIELILDTEIKFGQRHPRRHDKRNPERDLQKVKVPPHFRFKCVGCGRRYETSDRHQISRVGDGGRTVAYADLKGKAFVDYYCQPCALEGRGPLARNPRPASKWNPPGTVAARMVSVPWKNGQRIPVEKARAWVVSLKSPALLKQFDQAAALQAKANRKATHIVWKTIPVGSGKKLDSVMVTTHYGNSPELMYVPPKGSHKGRAMYRHKWGEGTGRSKPVPVLAAPGGRALIIPLGPGQKASDWLRG
jgi:hypothetical protein